jgi:hypothetical protein
VGEETQPAAPRTDVHATTTSRACAATAAAPRLTGSSRVADAPALSQSRLSTPHRLWAAVLASSCVVLGVLSVSAGVAFAAAPEKPETLAPENVQAESARFRGVLSPHAPGELGSAYRFLYNAGASCEGGSSTTEAASLGEPHEAVSESVFPLIPGTQYTVCLAVENTA